MNIKKLIFGVTAMTIINLASNLQAEEVEAVVELPDYNVVGQFLQTQVTYAWLTHIARMSYALANEHHIADGAYTTYR